MSNTDKLADFRREAIRLGIRVEPPSVDRSREYFDVRDGAILYSLAAVKGVGSQAVEHLVGVRGDRPFRDLADFASRIDPRLLNKRTLESLVAAGAFDELEPDRARLTEGLDAIMAAASRAREDSVQGQGALFGGPTIAEAIRLPASSPWLPADRLQREHAAIGFYLSAHPLDEYRSVLEKMRVQMWSDFQISVKRGATFGRLAGTVTSRQERKTRTGNKMGIVRMSDPTGSYEAVIFSEGLGQYRDLLEAGQSVVVYAAAEERAEGINVRIDKVEPLDVLAEREHQNLRVFLDRPGPVESLARHLVGPGDGEVSLVLILGKGTQEVEVRLPGRYRVSPQVAGAIRTVPGVVQVQMV